MAFMTQLLIAIALLAVAQAGYAGSYASSGTGAGSYAGNGFLFNPLPGFSHFPGFQFAFPQIHVPSPEDIANVKPGDGQTYNGIAVSSSSHMTRDKDGNVVRTGESTILTNDNGEVNKFTVGKSPKNQDEYNNDPVHEYETSEFPKFKPFKHHAFKHHVFKPITFKPIVFEPIVFEPIKPIDPEHIRNHMPGENEHFVGTHISSFSHSSNVNGVKSSSVGSDLIVNTDGVVDEKNIRVGQHDDPEGEEEREHGRKKETEREHEVEVEDED